MIVKFKTYKITQGLAMIVFGIFIILKQWANLSQGTVIFLEIASFILLMMAMVLNLSLYGSKNKIISKKYLACFTFFNIAAFINFIMWFF